MTTLLGGIQYTRSLNEGDYNGAFCCANCQNAAIDQILNNQASLVENTPQARARWQLLRLPALVPRLPMCDQQFLFTGALPEGLLPLVQSPVQSFVRDIAQSERGDGDVWFRIRIDQIIGCIEERAPMPRCSLLEYNSNPFDYFEWDERNRPNALVFGIELEMEPREGISSYAQQKIIDTLGNPGENFILKSDGSLSAGVELVTMPFTLAQHLDGTGVPWRDVLGKVKDIAKSGHDTDHCGIHIHINKKALSALTIGKMLVFLNSSDLSPLISIIAQRSNTSYAKRDSCKKLTDGTRSSENRYDIMNVSVRHPTCEIRMFKGNLTPERMFKNIEFCHALIQYCRQSSMRTLCDWGQFTRWLIAHRGQYQNLVRFLIDVRCVGVRQLAKDSRDGQVTIEDR